MYCNKCGSYVPPHETCTCQLNEYTNTTKSKAYNIIRYSFASNTALDIAILMSISVFTTFFSSGLLSCVIIILSCIALWLNYAFGISGRSSNPSQGMTLFSGILIAELVLNLIIYGLGSFSLLIAFSDSSITTSDSLALALTILYSIVYLVVFIKFFNPIRKTVLSIKQILWGYASKPEIDQFVINAFYIFSVLNVINVLLTMVIIPLIYNDFAITFTSSDNIFLKYFSDDNTLNMINTLITLAINLLSAHFLLDLKHKFENE